MHREVIDLPMVVAAGGKGVAVVAVATARREQHRTVAQTPGFALDSPEINSVIDYEVVTRVLADWHQDRVTRHLQGRDDRLSCAFALILGVVHVSSVDNESAGPWPE
jgi:hypothetical protein